MKTGSKLEQSALIEMRGCTEASRPLICKSRALPRSWLAKKLESDTVGVKYTTKGLVLSGSSVVGVTCSGWSVRAWLGKGYRAKVHQLFGSLYSGFPLVSGFRKPGSPTPRLQIEMECDNYRHRQASKPSIHRQESNFKRWWTGGSTFNVQHSTVIGFHFHLGSLAANGGLGFGKIRHVSRCPSFRVSAGRMS